MDQPKTTNRRVALIGWAVIAVFLLLFIEIGSYVVYRTVVRPRAGFLIYDGAPITDTAAYEEYLRIRDPLLGWPPLRPSTFYDESGSRPVPAFPVPGGEPVSLYGDSFVYGNEVGDDEAWGNQLSLIIGRRVANFGVAGYGTDQAYLRYRENPDDRAQVVFLGIYPLNVLRNVNQYRFLLTGAVYERFGFKPRFVLDDGDLRLVPMPTIPEDQLVRFAAAPEEFLSEEQFLPDTTSGPNRVGFPYSISLIRLFGKERTVNWLLNQPSWLTNVQPGHPSRSMETTAAIVDRFHRDCVARGATLVTVLFPTASSFDWYAESGTLAWDALAGDLEGRGIRVIDLVPVLSRRLAGDSYCELLTETEKCRGHLNPRGNRLLAEIIAEYLSTEHLLEPGGAGGVGASR